MAKVILLLSAAYLNGNAFVDAGATVSIGTEKHEITEERALDIEKGLATIAGSFIMSINDTPFIREAFAAFDIQEVETTWTIGAVATGAGAKVTELIIRNRPA